MINNKESFPQKATYWLGVVTIGLLVGLSLQFVRAWTEPTLAPPNGNVGAPINTSWNPQSKAGNLAVNALGISGSGAALQIPNGSVGIGTATPNSVKQNIIDVKDAWIRDANGGAGAWASAAGGGGSTINLGNGTVPPQFGSNKDCYWVNPKRSRWHNDICNVGYYVRGVSFWADNNWDNGNTLCCKIDTASPTYCANGQATGVSYGAWSACSGANVCGTSNYWSAWGQPNDCIQKTSTGTGTQTRTKTTCNADGIITATAESQSCSPITVPYCGSTTYNHCWPAWNDDTGNYPAGCQSDAPNCYDPYDPCGGGPGNCPGA